MGFSQTLKEFSDYFNEKMPDFFEFPEGSEQRVLRAMHYSLSNGGKRLRPFLVFEVAGIFGVDKNEALNVAMSLEMLHTYSLIHDDLPAMDNDDLRRGKPTCHKQFDEATAILAGDGLLTKAFEVLAKAKGIDDAKKIKLLSLLAERAGAYNGMVAGQMLDLQTDIAPQLSNEFIVKHIEEMKTGCLIAYACQAGAMLGNASEEEYNAITKYARAIGVAFQISDDILDVVGDEALMGKTLGKDAIQGKMTFVSLYGLEKAREVSAELIEQAKTVIDIFGEKANKLKDLADFIISRNY